MKLSPPFDFSTIDLEMWNECWVSNQIDKSGLREAILDGVDLEGINLSGADLSECSFVATNLTNANLSSARLDYVQARFACFDQANLESASLIGAKFHDASFINANLGKSDCSGTDFFQALLKGVNLTGAVFDNTSFAYAQMAGVDLRGLEIVNATFQGACLMDTDMRGCDFSYVATPPGDSEESVIEQVFRVNLSNAILRRAQMDEINLKGAVLSGAECNGAALCNANLQGADLRGANFNKSNMRGASLKNADLTDAKLRKAVADGANFTEANFSRANLTGASFRKAILEGAQFRGAVLADADLRQANLEGAVFIETDLNKANLDGCRIYGVSAWNICTDGAQQSNLTITPSHESEVQVDNLLVAQFIYLLLNSQQIRHVIDTITSKAVLILGRFTSERKRILDLLRVQLRRQGYLPILFDFDRPTNQTTVETVSTLAHLARFVIADLTDAKSVLEELSHIVPARPKLPIQPIILKGDPYPGMLDYFAQFPWFLPLISYRSNEIPAIAEMAVAAPEGWLKIARKSKEKKRKI